MLRINVKNDSIDISFLSILYCTLIMCCTLIVHCTVFDYYFKFSRDQPRQSGVLVQDVRKIARCSRVAANAVRLKNLGGKNLGYLGDEVRSTKLFTPKIFPLPKYFPINKFGYLHIIKF